MPDPSCAIIQPVFAFSESNSTGYKYNSPQSNSLIVSEPALAYQLPRTDKTIISYDDQSTVSLDPAILEQLLSSFAIFSKSLLSGLNFIHQSPSIENASKQVLSIVGQEYFNIENIFTLIGLSYYNNFEKQQLDITTFISEIFDEYKASLIEKKLGIVFNCSDIPPICTAPDVIRPIFENLIRNFIAFSPFAVDLQVNLDCERVNKKNWVSLMFANEANVSKIIGIERAFKLFYSSDNCRPGLGLGIVKKGMNILSGKSKIEFIEGIFQVTLYFPIN